MKVLGICCSPRKGQTTCMAMQTGLAAVREQHEPIETVLLKLAGLDLRPCLACGECKTRLACPIQDDFATRIPTLADAGVCGMMIGTPLCFGTMTAQCKILIDRCVMFRLNGCARNRDRHRGQASLAPGG